MKFILFTFPLLVSVILKAQVQWYPAGALPAGFKPTEFALSPSNEVYLAGQELVGGNDVPRMVKSVDNGATWTSLTASGLPNYHPTSVIFTGTDMLMVMRDYDNNLSDIYKSTNSGQSWTKFNGGLPAGLGLYYFTKNASGHLYVTESSGGGQLGVYKSTNSGASWTQINLSGISASWTGPLAFIYHSGTFYVDGNIGGDNWIYSSTDDCATWTNSHVLPLSFSSQLFVSSTGAINYISQTIPSTFTLLSNWTGVTMTGHQAMTNFASIVQLPGRMLMAGTGTNTATPGIVLTTQQPAGLGESSGISSLNLFPNPAVDFLYVNNIVDSEAEIIEITGRRLKVVQIKQGSIDVRDLPPGVYQLRIKDNDLFINKRFIKE
jgi:hypothetical protein